MKNKFLSVISLLFALILLAGCGKSVKVTKENVKELFTPTLEADVYMYGSAFYEEYMHAEVDMKKMKKVIRNYTK